MSKICSICGQTIEDNVVICPFCNNNPNNKNQENAVQSSDIQLLEQQEVSESSNEPIIMPQNPIESIISIEDNQIASSSPVEISDTFIETNTLNDEANNTFEEVVVDNVNLETVAVEENNVTLEVEERKIEMPEIPEATIGEINPDLLGNFYAENERQNNEKRALKKQQEEQERIRQEEALKNDSIPVTRPDLLAGVNLNGEEIPQQLPRQKKPKKGKGLKILIVLIIIIILLVVLWFLFLKDNI